MLQIDSLTKSFGFGAAKLEVLKGITLSVEQGELVALMGPSGCGQINTVEHHRWFAVW